MYTEFTCVVVVTARLTAIPDTLAEEATIWISNGERALEPTKVVLISKPWRKRLYLICCPAVKKVLKGSKISTDFPLSHPAKGPESS